MYYVCMYVCVYMYLVCMYIITIYVCRLCLYCMYMYVCMSSLSEDKSLAYKLFFVSVAIE